jgi:hypothetical protein
MLLQDKYNIGVLTVNIKFMWLTTSILYLPSMHQYCIYIYLNIWFVLWGLIYRTNVTSKAKPEMWDALKNHFLAKHSNHSMFIEDLVRWRQWGHYILTLQNSNMNILSRVKIKKKINISSINVLNDIFN